MDYRYPVNNFITKKEHKIYKKLFLGAEELLQESEVEYLEAEGSEYMNFPAVNQMHNTHEYMNITAAVQKDFYTKPKT